MSEENETKREVPKEIFNAVTQLDVEEDFDIMDYTKRDKLKELNRQFQENKRSQIENMKKMKEFYEKNEKNDENKEGLNIQPAEKIANQRISRKQKKDENIKEEIKNAGLTEKDYAKVVNKLKTTIKGIEDAAKKIESSKDFSIDIDTLRENRETFMNFLTKTKFTTIKLNDFINNYNILKYDYLDSPDSFIDIPEQLVIIEKLNKIFNFQFIQESDISIKFTDIDRCVCAFLLQQKDILDFNNPHALLNEFMKKIFLASFTDTELAFKSELNWIKPEFKNLIKTDVIMLQSLPSKLKKSFNIFIEELTKTKDARIFKDITKLDYIVQTASCGIIEETLARSIKCMSPMFIFDYYQAIKSMYLFTGLLNVYMNKVYKKELEVKPEDIDVMIKVCNIIYQNTRLYQNSTARSLPYSKTPMSEQLQAYYLNHTVKGPQYMMLKMFERAVPAIYFDIAKTK